MHVHKQTHAHTLSLGVTRILFAVKTHCTHAHWGKGHMLWLNNSWFVENEGAAEAGGKSLLLAVSRNISCLLSHSK